MFLHPIIRAELARERQRELLADGAQPAMGLKTRPVRPKRAFPRLRLRTHIRTAPLRARVHGGLDD